MSIRWSCGISLAWTPILTYTRRRLALLDAFERQIPLVAFRDVDDSLGFAIGDIDTRVRVARGGLSVTTWSQSDTLSSVMDGPLTLLLEVLEPSDVELASIWQMTSAGTPASDYDRAIQMFARRVTGMPSGSPVAGEDAAVLVDVSTVGYTGQVEYGLVSLEELEERVRTPGLGRLEAPDEVPHGSGISRRLREAPPVSLFAESRLRPANDAEVSSSEEVWQHLRAVQNLASELSEMLADELFKEEA